MIKQEEKPKKQNLKFTCRYDIPFENHLEFQLAKKIIGHKGCNMKKIIQKALYVRKYDIQKNIEVAKLRLRGRGSGYKEGAEQKESQECLHLCVSSKYEDIFESVCGQVEDLIALIYKEYQQFCHKHHYVVHPFEIKRQYSRPSPKEGLVAKSFAYSGTLNPSQIQELIEERNKARRELNFSEADGIRDYLKSKGVVLIDEKGRRGNAQEVTSWHHL